MDETQSERKEVRLAESRGDSTGHGLGWGALRTDSEAEKPLGSCSRRYRRQVSSIRDRRPNKCHS